MYGEFSSLHNLDQWRVLQSTNLAMSEDISLNQAFFRILEEIRSSVQG